MSCHCSVIPFGRCPHMSAPLWKTHSFQPFLLDGVAGDPALNQVDRIHPNPQGVKVLVARMRPAVEALIARIPTGPSGEG